MDPLTEPHLGPTFSPAFLQFCLKGCLVSLCRTLLCLQNEAADSSQMWPIWRQQPITTEQKLLRDLKWLQLPWMMGFGQTALLFNNSLPHLDPLCQVHSPELKLCFIEAAICSCLFERQDYIEGVLGKQAAKEAWGSTSLALKGQGRVT